jgi:hypothetical protein
MYYIVYKTTNTINGKFYVGKHKCKDISKDKYLGSGRTLKKAIKKYGREAFVREILGFFDTESEALDFEENIVTEELIKEEICYNETIGGRGSFYHINKDENKINPMHNPKVVDKIKEHYKLNGVTEKQLSPSKQNIKQAIKSNIGRKRPDHAKKISVTTKKHWETNKEKMRDSLSSWYLVISPTGEKFKTNRLQEFCISMGWNPLVLYNNGKVKKRGLAAGWQAIKQETNNEKHSRNE